MTMSLCIIPGVNPWPQVSLAPQSGPGCRPVREAFFGSRVSNRHRPGDREPWPERD